MELQVDQERFVAPLRGNTLVEVLDAVAALLRDQGRGVTRILINGDDVPFEALTNALLCTPVANLRTVELETERIITLARRDLDDLDQTLINLPLICHTLAQLFHDSATNEGAEHFANLRDAWVEINQRQNAAANALGTRLVSISAEGHSAGEHAHAVEKQLELVTTALRKNDRVTASDLLEYELAPLAEIETAITGELHRRLCEAEDAR